MRRRPGTRSRESLALVAIVLATAWIGASTPARAESECADGEEGYHWRTEDGTVGEGCTQLQCAHGEKPFVVIGETEPRCITIPVTKRAPAPVYPEAARREGVEGLVVLSVIVNEKGRVRNVKVVRTPAKNWGFEEAAREAVLRRRYAPAKLGLQPVAIHFMIAVNFKLNR